MPAVRFREAFDAVRERLAALPAPALAVVNLEIPSAVITVLGCLPEIRALRPRIGELPGLDVALVDELETYALALGHAHALLLAASAPPEPVDGLVAELTELRDTLESDAAALAKRKLVDGARLAELRGGAAYRNVVFDVLLLVAVLRDRASVIAGKSAVEPGDLDRAEELAQRLAHALGQREQAPPGATAASDTRQRAFTLFVSAWDETRRAVGYLRWHAGDADSIAPSLYAGRARKRSDADAAAAGDTGLPPTGSPIPPGMPGSSPFMSEPS